MTDEYFAGLFDGEAYIGITKMSKERGEVPTITVSMTDEKTVRAIKEYFGCGSVWVYHPKISTHKIQYRWKARQRKALEVIKRVRPYLITKADAADLVLSHKADGKTP